MNQLELTAKPFLKWAGGKTQLLQDIEDRLPEELIDGRIRYYIEPFVGSGAVLFYLIQRYPIERAAIWDVNPELINVYVMIKQHVHPLIAMLKKLDAQYNEDENNERRKELYLYIRDKFNSSVGFQKGEESTAFLAERASEFIFLNRTCFNGLFRVNKSGKFNVPMGNYKTPKICDEDNLLAVHHILQKVDIYEGKYEESISSIEKLRSDGERVFVYFDPPYRPLNASSSFKSYSKYDFNDENQKELASYFRKLDCLGMKVMLSNSDPKNEVSTDDFFDNLFEGFHIKRVDARRNINSKGDKRGQIKELLITNYQ